MKLTCTTLPDARPNLILLQWGRKGLRCLHGESITQSVLPSLQIPLDLSPYCSSWPLSQKAMRLISPRELEEM